MADQTPPNDPLDARLRATFAAEHADIERRRLPQKQSPTPKPSVRWIPFAAAAGVIAIAAIAGIAFFGNRSDDQAVELDIAVQPDPTLDAPDTENPAAEPTPDSQPVVDGEPAPNTCGEPVPLMPHFVWDVAADDPDGGLIAHSTPGVDEPVTRVLAFNHVAMPTSGCALSDNGSQWYQLFHADDAGNTTFDWVNSRFLRPPIPACLVGDLFDDEPLVHTVEPGDTLGLIANRYNVALDEILQTNPALDPMSLRVNELILIPGSEPFFHTIETGDRLASIAEKYNVTVDVIVRANPEMDPDLIIAGQLLRIPGADFPMGSAVDGYAIFVDNRAAFATTGGMDYRWYSSDVVAAASCFEFEAPEPSHSPVCLSGEISLIDLAQSQPVWTGFGPMTAWRGGPAPEPLGSTFAEVSLLTPDGQTLIGYIDPSAIDIAEGHCIFDGPDSLEQQPCTQVAGADPTAGFGTDGAGRRWTAGDASSTADHVHDIRTESNGDCTRIVVTFGSGANQAEQSAPELPPIFVDQTLTSVRISANGWQMESAFGDPDRVDYEDGIGLITLGFDYELAAEFLHRDREPHVRFFEGPARVVIDLFPYDSSATVSSGPFGERFVLEQPIQQDLTGPGVPVDSEIVVSGFGRPFEAAGLYRVWSVPPDVSAAAFLADPGEPLIEDFFPTGGWAEGWGSFTVRLPQLDPGTYIAVFGELPPTDEIGFYGTGQLFRITGDPSAPGPFPEATLLPDVQLAPEF